MYGGNIPSLNTKTMYNNSRQIRLNSPSIHNDTGHDGIYSSFLPRVSIHDQIQVGENALGKPVYLDTGWF